MLFELAGQAYPGKDQPQQNQRGQPKEQGHRVKPGAGIVGVNLAPKEDAPAAQPFFAGGFGKSSDLLERFKRRNPHGRPKKPEAENGQAGPEEGG